MTTKTRSPWPVVATAALSAGAVAGLVWMLRPRATQDAPLVDHSDIQGNVLRPYNFRHARYVFLHVDDGREAREWLTAAMPALTNAVPWPRGHKPESTVNVAFTWRGLQALGVPENTLATFPEDFRAGMRARADLLWDKGDSAPGHWDPAWLEGRVQVFVSINAQTEHALEERWAWLQRTLDARAGLSLVAYQDAGQLIVDGRPSRKEHFGFTDGYGDPDVAGSGFPQVPGRGKPVPGGWEPLATGEFLLGYADETGALAAAPRPFEFARNGTFLVYRKLHQRVATFRRFLREQGASYPGGAELLGARIIGRWRDGTPSELSPARPEPGLAGRPDGNDFRYGRDGNGSRCPIGAHIRRANPRDALGSGNLVDRHRILRRGVPYGSWIPLDQDGDDNGEHGMIFMALNASIERQFEFVNREWLNYGNDFGAGNDKDVLTGQHLPGGRVTIQGNDASFPPERPRIIADLPRFVVTRGGDYFFTPGMTALRMLAAGSISPS
jgi:Dyp-type peroxidase family